MKMNIALIIVGLILIAIGASRMFVASTDVAEPVIAQAPAPEPKVVVVEKTVHDTVTVESERPSSTPKANSSKAKGDDFEDFVVNLLADYHFTLLDRTQDHVSSAGVVAESCKNPDLHVEQKRGKAKPIDYYLECKYRSRWDNGVVTFEDWQFDRYRQFQRENRRKVIIALGVGGTAANPKTFMLVPLDSIEGNTIRQIKTQFAVDPTPTNLAEYMNQYFTTVFVASKTRKQDKK